MQPVISGQRKLLPLQRSLRRYIVSIESQRAAAQRTGRYARREYITRQGQSVCPLPQTCIV